MNRRDFLAQSSTAATLAMAAQLQAAEKPVAANDQITLAAIGVRGRGGHVLSTFASLPEVNVKYICDVDQNVLGQRTEQTAKATGRKPEMEKDFRTALDDPEVDAVLIGTPEHWHALPMIMAAQAGKDVYVEKPDGHNILESRTMVEAQRKYKRVVQLGTQSRSGKHFQDAVEYVRSGKIGKVRFAKAWESGRQGSIGKPVDSDPPAGVDYDFWLGPAPKRPFNVRRFHGNWRWFFDYGTGDLGNDGVHRLDVARWAFDAGLTGQGEEPLGPVQAVSAHGAKCYFDDLQEWPDNYMATYDFGHGRIMTYEMRLWSPYPLHGETEGAAVYGDEGYVVLGNSGWKAYGPKDKLIREESGTYGNDLAHVKNFLDCMRTRERTAADLETVGHFSSMLCHMGNAAWRAGQTVHFDQETFRFKEEMANQFLTRPEYRKPWVLPSLSEV